MPNHVKNVIEFEGGRRAAEPLLDAVCAPGRDGEADYVIDFNKVIPMPPELSISSGSKTGASIAAARLLDGRPLTRGMHERIEELSAAHRQALRSGRAPSAFADYLRRLSDEGVELDLELGRRGSENLDRYGCATWYDWRNANWGTKWNSYEGALTEKGVSFLTAWSAPEPVLEALARKFPQASFRCLSSEECNPESYLAFTYEGGRLREASRVIDPEGVEAIWRGNGERPFCYAERRRDRCRLPESFSKALSDFLERALPDAPADFRERIAQAAQEASRHPEAFLEKDGQERSR